MRRGPALYLAMTLAAAASPARAQAIEAGVLGSEIPPSYSRGRNVSVLERAHPECEAPGLKTGGFTLFPAVETGPGYLSNVFAVRENAQADGYVAIDPSLTVRSDWSRHQLNVAIGGAFREFFSHREENEDGWFLTGDGRLDISRDDVSVAGVQVRRLYEERDSGDYPTSAAGPLPFVESRIFGRMQHEGGRTRIIGAVDLSHFSFGDVPALGGGTIAEGDRDRTIARFSARAEFAFTPAASIFGEIGSSSSSYDADLSSGAANRSSRDYRILGGASFDLSALTRGVIGIGFIDREYRSGAYRDIAGFALDARVEYFPTPLTTFTLAAARQIEDAVVLNSGGYLNTVASLRVDHELLRNLLLHVRIAYEADDFRGVGRSDGIVSVGAGAIYQANRGVGLKSELAYVDRSSSGALQGPRFDEFRAVSSVVLRR